MNTNGRPNSACDYGSFLVSKGFSVVNTDNYISGDIAVFDAFKTENDGF